MTVRRTHSISVGFLLELENLGLTVVAGEKGLSRPITSAEANRPAIELFGIFDYLQPDRVQILGSGETAHIQSRSTDPEMEANLRRLFSSGIPCCVVTNGRTPPSPLPQLAEEIGVPLLVSSHNTTRFTKRLWEHLERALAPVVIERGVLMDVYNIGTLIQGDSGVGKSECALELMERGHTFVADDLIEVRSPQESRLVGSGRGIVPYHMEIRGIGIIDVSRIFGPRSIRGEKQIDLIVELQDWNPDVEYERVGIVQRYKELLNVKVPYLLIPVRPGRNISTIIEIAAVNQKLISQGVHMAAEFDRKLIQAMREQTQR
ncbi:MAG TPA: HPr(Ser) kinase/phosphatase [bacterium]|nr:HPr(Ser) kinase/phosphatase [bacterium]HQL63826.1 HPr(Ser) kinase/phosphatase [bacterium]